MVETYTYMLIESPIGQLMAIATAQSLVVLEFYTETSVAEFTKKYGVLQRDSKNAVLVTTTMQLAEYFAGTRKSFSLPLLTPGTVFQDKAWMALQEIPYAETRSYEQQAIVTGNKKAVRAVAGANHSNPIAIIIPCHRVIGKDGSLTGYGGGLWRKEWLLQHEKKHA